MSRISSIVLAAGDGTRMRSERPKPLHLVCGRPMVMHVIHAMSGLDVDRTIVVVGHGAERVSRKVTEQAPTDLNVSFVEQRSQRGTGDAVMVALTAFDDTFDIDDLSTVLVLPADTPLLLPGTLAALIAQHEADGNAATILSAEVGGAAAGRIVRDKHKRVASIADARYSSSEELEVTEVSTGVFAFRRDLLGPALRRLAPDTMSRPAGFGEYVLTDVIAVLHDTGHRVGSLQVGDPAETQAVNDRFQLAMAERELRARTNRSWMLAGVTMFDPRQTFIDVTVKLGSDVTLFPGTILQGDTVIGDGCEIGPDTRLVDCTVEDGVIIENSVCRQAVIGTDSHVGPYASLSEGAKVAPGTSTGPFYTGVERV
jgi:bifunctional UDP-N-acetylglucosamine pyrophosphorylase / glucosamine-1-phosphate N-acetyltransferase